MEQVHPEPAAAGGQERPVGAEADVPVGIEVEPVQGLRQGRDPRLERDRGELARPAHDVLEAERVRARRRALLRGGGGGGGQDQALQQGAAVQRRHRDAVIGAGVARGDRSTER